MIFSGKRQKMEEPLNIAHTTGTSAVDVESTKLRKTSVETLACSYYCERKKRCCRVHCTTESRYCVEHSGFLQDGNVRKRVPCPLDNRHSCYEDRLEKHLKKCTARPQLKPAWYKEDINLGETGEDEPCKTKVSLRTANIEEVEELILKVKQTFTDHIKEVKTEVLFHPVMEEESKKPMNGPSAQKHIAQQASLIGLMQKHGLLQASTCYAEFGAGKGGLSHWLQKAVHECTDTQFVLIDKGCVRYKLDNYHKGSHQGPTFERIKMDIQHLDINCLPNFHNNRAIVCTGKHLCGAATDLMLRCAMGFCRPKGEEDDNDATTYKSSSVKGIALALCCHHRCEWRSYVGKEFLKTCGLSTSNQFQLLCGMTSWATCASQHVQKESPSEGTSHDAPLYNHFRYGNLLPQDREKLGNMAKNIIDWGRVMYLRQHGYNTELVQYVDRECTLENVCLIAKIDRWCDRMYRT